MREDKAYICHELARLLNITRDGWDIEDIIYERGSDDHELAHIRFDGGHIKTVNVTMDSGVAMIRDIMRVI